MTPNDDVHVSAQGSCRRPVAGLSRCPRTGPTAVGLVFAAATLAGCSFSDGLSSYLVDPGHYSVYHCKDLVVRLNQLLAREKDLRNLMDRASEGGGGAVIGALSYRTDYEKVLADEAVLRRTAAEKKCELGPPPSSQLPGPSAAPASPPPATPSVPPTRSIYQSDQIIH
jgi:hypothetical protein